MSNNTLFQRVCAILITTIVLLFVSVATVAMATPVESTEHNTEVVAEAELDPVNDQTNSKEDANKSSNKELITAIYSLVGVVGAAIIAGIIQLIISRKSLRSAKEQFDSQMKQSNEQFDKQIAQSQEQFDLQIKQAKEQFDAQMAQTSLQFLEQREKLKEEHDREAKEKAFSIFGATTDRYYKNNIRIFEVCTRLQIELSYLNNVSAPEFKKQRMNIGAYPRITTRLEDFIFDIDVKDEFRSNIGALRYRIDVYNAAAESGKGPDILENALSYIQIIVQTLLELTRKELSDIESGISYYERTRGREVLQFYGLMKQSEKNHNE